VLVSLEADAKVKKFAETNLDRFTKPEHVNARRLLYFGEFGYRYGNLTHEPAPIPDVIQEVIGKLTEKFPNQKPANSCLITYYENGKHSCPAHSDDEPFFDVESDIVTLSLGSPRTMQFTERRGSEKKDLVLQDNSVTVFSRYSQNDWRHSILPDEDISEPRISLTFRYLAPYNLNSTLICGDSNTEALKFGTGKGSFGKWLPGKRMKSSRIKNIPTPDKMGPYRNLVLHVGINDISDSNCKPFPELAEEYEEKCKDVMYVYPNMNIFVSLIMPTKNTYLNCRANEFNYYLIQMVAKYPKSMSLIKHGSLVDDQGFLNASYGRFKNGHPSVDVVHLGDEGYRVFVKNMRDSVISRRKRVRSTNIVPYKDDGIRSLSQRPVPRSPQPPRPQPDLQPNPFSILHPSRSSGFLPFPAHAQQSQSPFPTPGSFNGDYHAAALGKTNYALPYPGSDDRHHY
jgi:alkylated DNA repair dioxygenase AlkB